MIRVDEVRERVLRGEAIDINEAEQLYELADKRHLYHLASEVREKFAGKIFDSCSIVNAKRGKCEDDCKWCSQSVHHNSKINSYELIDPKEAINLAQNNEENGIKRFSLVTSGRALSNKIKNRIIGIYKEIQIQTNLEMCASFGLISTEQLIELKKTGISHYLCNLEASRSYFSTLCSTHSYDEKISVIRAAQKAGLKVCSGGIIGMGETMKQRIELAFQLRELGVKSVPLNILSPVDGTPLAGQKVLSYEEVLTTFALFRLILPDANIRFSGGRNQIKQIQSEALKSGINAALVDDLLTIIGSDIKEDMKQFQFAGFEV